MPVSNVVLNDGTNDVTFKPTRQDGGVTTYHSRDDALAAASKELSVSNRGTPRTGNKARLKLQDPIKREFNGVAQVIGTNYGSIDLSIAATASREERIAFRKKLVALCDSALAELVVDDLSTPV